MPGPKQDDRVPATNFCATLAANVDNGKLSDAEFREFVRNTLPIVDFPRRKPTNEARVLEERSEVERAFAALLARAPGHRKDVVKRLMHMCVTGSVHSYKHPITRKGFDFDEATGEMSGVGREGRITGADRVLGWVASEE